jgi:hypothetical protein
MITQNVKKNPTKIRKRNNPINAKNIPKPVTGPIVQLVEF